MYKYFQNLKGLHKFERDNRGVHHDGVFYFPRSRFSHRFTPYTEHYKCPVTIDLFMVESSAWTSNSSIGSLWNKTKSRWFIDEWQENTEQQAPANLSFLSFCCPNSKDIFCCSVLRFSGVVRLSSHSPPPRWLHTCCCPSRNSWTRQLMNGRKKLNWEALNIELDLSTLSRFKSPLQGPQLGHRTHSVVGCAILHPHWVLGWK